MLFENYCLYCWNDVPDEFEKNYLSDILKVRRRNEVAAANEQKKAKYHDGYVGIYQRKKETLTRNTNVQSLNDQEFADQNSFSLSLKIRTQRPQMEKGLHSGCFAVIGKTLYSVEYIDRNETEYYMYLEKIRELEE